MHSAPPVVYPVGRFVWGPHLAFALAVLVFGTIAVWLVWTDASDVRCTWAVCICMLTAACSAWCMPREFLQQGELAWDGEAWHWQSPAGDEMPIHLSLTFDGGHFVWVSLRFPALQCLPTLPRHAWLRRADMPSRWHGFRCAVYSRRTAFMRTT